MKRINPKRLASAALALVLALSMALPAAAANGGAAGGVSQEMCSASYWQQHTVTDANAVMMTASEIDSMNDLIYETSGISTFDLENLKPVYNAASQKTSLADISIPTRDLYINGKKIDNNAYYTAIMRAISDTGYSEKERGNTYAICTSCADVKSIPTDDIIGYTASDPDDEMQSSSLLVNEPFVIRQKCDIGGKTFYWGYANNVSGWVNAENLAVCSSRDEWLDAWKVKTDEKDFIVVTQDKITLEPSVRTPNSSEVKLTLGTILKLVPDSKMPENIGERGMWNNYVVYLPVRLKNGSYAKEPALIAQHYSVSTGFLPLTQANVLNLAFSCLGNRYGWGNMLDSMDCSGFVRNIYRCFGLSLPRNTTWQQMVPGTKIDLSGLTDSEKAECLKALPAGSALYFPGHTMVYTGTVGGVSYVISDTGSLADSTGSSEVRSMYSVILTPLTVRRRDGTTWLRNLTGAVVTVPCSMISDCDITVKRTASGSASVIVKNGGKTLQNGKDYILMYPENKVTVIGTGDFCGVKRFDIPTFTDVSTSDYFYDAVKWAVDTGATTGVSKTEFAPNRTCTRAELIVMLYRMAGSPTAEGDIPFTDVPDNVYYTEAVRWAASSGIVDTDKETLAPGTLCTRSEFVTMFYRAAGSPESSTDLAFTDIGENDDRAAIGWAVSAGITNGVSDTLFAPNTLCTRAHLVTMLYRMYNQK